MSILRLRSLLAVLSLAAFLSACGGGHSAAPPSDGLTLVPGDRQVTVTWKADTNVDYWLFYAPSTSISTDNWTSIPGSRVVMHITSPYVVTGLTNGTTYSFTLNGRTNNGPGGSGTPSVATVPRMAGTTWTVGGALGSSEIRGVAAYVPATSGTAATYVAIGASGALYKSVDGVTWAASTASWTGNLNAVQYMLGLFVAVGDGGAALYSADGTTWTAASSGTTARLNAIASNGSVAVAVGDGGALRYSNDGANWAVPASVPTTENLYGVAYSPQGLWIAVGARGTVLTSTDGSTWNAVGAVTTADLKGAAVLSTTTNNVTTYTLVAVGNSGTVVVSKDNATWTAQTLNSAVNFNAISGWSQLVAVGSGGTIVTSVDGVTWVSPASGVTANLLAVTAAQGQYLAAGQGGVSVYSR